MGLNDTPSADRVHIGFFGRRNAGKSSVVNAVTGQELAIVSETKGTTTDPVEKAAPGSIRGDFGLETQFNLVHGSDSPESAAREIGLWFPALEV